MKYVHYETKTAKGYGYQKKAGGHIFEPSEYGGPNYFAFDIGFHNGPRCVICHMSECHHCSNWDTRPCRYIKGVKVTKAEDPDDDE